MKITFIAPRQVVDVLVGRAVHQAVLLEGGDWLCVAEVLDDQLRADVLGAEGTEVLPANGSRRGIGAGAVGRLRAPGLTPDASTVDAVTRVVADRGMPTVLALLERGR